MSTSTDEPAAHDRRPDSRKRWCCRRRSPLRHSPRSSRASSSNGSRRLPNAAAEIAGSVVFVDISGFTEPLRAAGPARQSRCRGARRQRSAPCFTRLARRRLRRRRRPPEVRWRRARPPLQRVTTKRARAVPRSRCAERAPTLGRARTSRAPVPLRMSIGVHSGDVPLLPASATRTTSSSSPVPRDQRPSRWKAPPRPARSSSATRRPRRLRSLVLGDAEGPAGGCSNRAPTGGRVDATRDAAPWIPVRPRPVGQRRRRLARLVARRRPRARAPAVHGRASSTSTESTPCSSSSGPEERRSSRSRTSSAPCNARPTGTA